MEEIMNNINYSKNKIKLLDNADVVVIGGGSGLNTVLSGIKNYTKNTNIEVTIACR